VHGSESVELEIELNCGHVIATDLVMGNRRQFWTRGTGRGRTLTSAKPPKISNPHISKTKLETPNFYFIVTKHGGTSVDLQSLGKKLW